MRKNLRRLRAFGVVGAASLLAVGGGIVASATASASVNPNNVRVALAGTQTGLATAKALQKAAPALPAHITASVYLADRDAAGLTAFAKAVSTPGTAQYQHYLTAAQAKSLFAPTAAEAHSVEGWATGNGLQRRRGDLRLRRACPGHRHGKRDRARVRREVRQLQGGRQEAGPAVLGAGGGRLGAGLHSRRRADGDRPRQRQAPGDAGRDPAAAAAELLRRAVVLGVLRPEGRRPGRSVRWRAPRRRSRP